MAQYSAQLLSGTPAHGRVIPVAQTSTPGTVIHTATNIGTSDFDEVYAWATNVTGSPATLTIEWGGTAAANHLVESFAIPANSAPIPIATGQRINGGLVVAAFSNSANAINISGFVNRIQ